MAPRVALDQPPLPNTQGELWRIRHGTASSPDRIVPRQPCGSLAERPALPYKSVKSRSAQACWSECRDRKSWRRGRRLEEIMAASMAEAAVALDRDTLLGMYEKMTQIRTFEDLAGKNFAAGLVPGFVHLYAGEEAVAVGIC